MRILLATNGFLPEIGAIQTYGYELAKNLFYLGEEIIVLAPGMKGDSEFDRKQNFKIIRTKKTVTSRIAFLAIVKRKRVQRILVVHGTHYIRLASLANAFFKIPYDITVYLEDILFPERKKIIQKSFRRASKIITSPPLQEKLIEIGIPEKKIVVLHPGVDPIKFNPQIDPSRIKKKYNLENKKVILTVSRLDQHKNHDKVLRALPQVLRRIPNLVYLIVGQGEEEKYLRKIVRDLKLERKVIFIGEVVHKEIPLYYAACDVFIMLSSMAGFGMVYLEANACGKPVIGGRIGGAINAITDGETGLLVDPFDTNQIADALIRLLTNPEFAQKLGERGRQRVEKEFNWKRIAQRVLEIIRH